MGYACENIFHLIEREREPRDNDEMFLIYLMHSRVLLVCFTPSVQ